MNLRLAKKGIGALLAASVPLSAAFSSERPRPASPERYVLSADSPLKPRRSMSDVAHQGTAAAIVALLVLSTLRTAVSKPGSVKAAIRWNGIELLAAASAVLLSGLLLMLPFLWMEFLPQIAMDTAHAAAGFALLLGVLRPIAVRMWLWLRLRQPDMSARIRSRSSAG